MELMVSAALFPSIILCLCCLWYQMCSHRKATRKIGDAKSMGDGRSAKGRRFTAGELPGELPGDTLDSIDEWDEDGKPRQRGRKQQSAWQRTAAKAKQQARGRAQTNSWAVTTAKAKEHSRSEAMQISQEANRLPPLPSADGTGGVVERSWMRERTWMVERAPAAAGGRGDDPFARRKLPSIRDAALGTMGDAPQPHRPSPMPALEQAGGERLSLSLGPMPPVQSASSGALSSICKSAIQQNIVAPRARRPAPPPPTETGQPLAPSRWAALAGPFSASPQVPKAKRPPPPPPTSSPPPRRSLSTSFDEQRRSEPPAERDQAMRPASSWAKLNAGRSASTPASKRSTVQILVPSGSKTGRDDRGGGVSCALSRTALSSYLAPLSSAELTLPPPPLPPPLPPPPPPPPPPAGRSRWDRNALSSCLAPLPYRDAPK